MGFFGGEDSKKQSDGSGSNENAANQEIGKIAPFISENPQSLYLIDSKKNTDKSIICRKNEDGGQTCLNLDINGIKLFKTMQDFNYFCSLTNDMEATHFECRKIQ